jgi:very-short-patch-repair endonuclease
MTKHYNRTSEKEKRRLLRQEQTASEKLVWYYLRNRRLKKCKFRRQYSIDQFVIDFYYPEFKLAIEIDGGIHSQQKEYDVERQKFLEIFGIKFVRITNNELLGNPYIAFEKIEQAIENLTPAPLLTNERD